MFRVIFRETEISLYFSGEMGWETCAVWLDFVELEEMHSEQHCEIMKMCAISMKTQTFYWS